MERSKYLGVNMSNLKKVTLYPRKVEQEFHIPTTSEQKRYGSYTSAAIYTNQIPKNIYNPNDFKCINPETNPLKCESVRGKCYSPANRKDPRAYHHWDNLQELEGDNRGIAQCGQPTDGSRNITHHGIVAYRDLGAITGASGTMPQPARLKFSDFDFAGKGINLNTKIHSIGFIFQHRRSVVITAKPPYEYSKEAGLGNFGIGLDGGNLYPNYKTLKTWFSSDGQQISNTWGIGSNTSVKNPSCKKDAQGKWKWDTIAERHLCSVNPLMTIENILNNFAMHLAYGGNLTSQRGILYLKDVHIEVFYDPVKPFISKVDLPNELYTSKNTTGKCFTSIKQQIIAGEINMGGTIGQGNQSSYYNNIRCDKKTIPNGVTVEEISRTPQNGVIYTITDHSGVEGEKNIRYYLDNNTNLSISNNFIAKKYKKPQISFYKEYKKNAPYVAQTQYIIAKNGCCDTIEIYFDNIESNPLVLKIDCSIKDDVNLLNYDSQDMQTNAKIKSFYDKVQTLSCGTHKIFIRNGSDSEIEYYGDIKIIPQEFKFKIYDPNNQFMTYAQNKSSPNQTVKIKRIDSEPTQTVNVKVSNSGKLGEETTISLVKGEEKNYQISKYYPGTFSIFVKENSNGCKETETKQNFKITPSDHIQYHDTLFVRGEDSTSFDYNYLVAWEGDNIKTPVTFDSIEKGASIDDIRLCSKSIVSSGLSQTGFIPLVVKNIGNNGSIKNCQIELNVYDELDDGSISPDPETNDWVTTSGIFYNFYKKFHEYNKDIQKNIELKNIDENNNLVAPNFNITGEENVYINIKEIPEDEQIEIKIPFESKNPSVKYLRYYIFQEAQQFNPIEKCNSSINDGEDYVKIYVYDSILTDLSITGDTDLLNPSTTIDDCPNVCYTTKDGVTYRVTNIDSSNYGDTGIDKSTIAPLIIENSVEMIPYAYRFKDDEDKTPLSENQNNVSNRLIFNRDEVQKTSYLSNQLIKAHVKFPNDVETLFKVRTDKSGDAIFNIPIPQGVKPYTVEELLSDVVYIEYSGDIEYKPSSIEIGSLQKFKTRVTNIGVLYDNKIYKTSDSIKIPANKQVKLLYKIEYQKNDKWFTLQDKTIFLYKNTDKKQILISNDNSDYNITANIKTDKLAKPNDILADYNIVFNSDSLYKSYNPNNISIDDYRDETSISFVDNWKLYKAGQSAQIKVNLSAIHTYIKNYITFNAEIDEPTSYDEVTIYYKMCNLQEYQCGISKIDFDKARECQKNKGIFLTTFKTDTYKLVEKEVSKNIYCGINSEVNISTKLEKKIIENGKINVIYLEVENGVKDNENVEIQIDLGRKPTEYLGDYNYITIDNEDGDFSYRTETVDDYEKTILTWLIGDMEAYTKSKASIKILADDIGLSNISIDAFDKTHPQNGESEEAGQNPCEEWECPNQ